MISSRFSSMGSQKRQLRFAERRWRWKMGSAIGWAAAIGGVILALALLYAVLNNRRSAAQKRLTEEATRDLYAESDRNSRAIDRSN
jgi:hypothetical protein